MIFKPAFFKVLTNIRETGKKSIELNRISEKFYDSSDIPGSLVNSSFSSSCQYFPFVLSKFSECYQLAAGEAAIGPGPIEVIVIGEVGGWGYTSKKEALVAEPSRNPDQTFHYSILLEY